MCLLKTVAQGSSSPVSFLYYNLIYNWVFLLHERTPRLYRKSSQMFPNSTYTLFPLSFPSPHVSRGTASYCIYTVVVRSLKYLSPIIQVFISMYNNSTLTCGFEKYVPVELWKTRVCRIHATKLIKNNLHRRCAKLYRVLCVRIKCLSFR